MPRKSYREFEYEDLKQFRKKLINKRGSALQRQFLNAARNSADFVNFIERNVLTTGDNEFQLHSPMTEREFIGSPPSTEEKLYDSWRGLTPNIACRSTFWTRVTLDQIRNNRIYSSFLAAEENAGGGLRRIDHLLQDTKKDVTQQVDSCVRTILRRLGGLPEVRGNRSVYVDCTFGRAWWRGCLVSEVVKDDIDLKEDVWNVLQSSKTFWERLVSFVVSRNSTFGSTEIRKSLILSLAELSKKKQREVSLKATELEKVCRVIGSIQASRELSILPDEELRSIMREVVESNILPDSQ